MSRAGEFIEAAALLVDHGMVGAPLKLLLRFADAFDLTAAEDRQMVRVLERALELAEGADAVAAAVAADPSRVLAFRQEVRQ